MNNKSTKKSGNRSAGHGTVGRSLLSLVFWIGDLVMVLLAAYSAYFIRFGNLSLPNRYELLTVVGVLVGFFVFSSSNLQQFARHTLSFDLILGILRASAGLAFIMIVFLFVTKTSAHYSRIWLVTWFFLVPVLMIGSRLVVIAISKRMPERLGSRVGVTLIGRAESCRRVIEAMGEEDPDLVVDSILVTDRESLNLADDKLPKPLPFSKDLDLDLVGPEIWICMPLSDGAILESVLATLAGCVANIRLIPDMSDFLLVNYSVTDIYGMPAFSLTTSPMQGVAPLIKSLEDRTLALLFLLLAAPVMLLVALGVKLSSPGPVFYQQPRVGWNGRIFNILKFRSMPVDLEDDGVQWGNAEKKVKGRFGRFIRATSLDELPQLINVLRGDMSLVGPRPERPEFVEQFKREIPGYMQKHLVKAGITGWAQLHGWRGDTDLKKRIEFDLYYVENWSLWMDIRIIFQTVLGIALRKL